MSERAPLTPADADVTTFKWMPLEVQRLRRSRSWLICKRKPELAFFMVNLWCAAWHEKPAGSLEDDDDVLADLAMCDPHKWPDVRADVLRGWVKCSDGRLYNPTVCEKAKESWQSRLEHFYKQAKDRLRKLNKQRATDKLEPIAELTFEQWNEQRLSAGVPPDRADCSTGTEPSSAGKKPARRRKAGGIPAEKALKGEGEERERKGTGEGTGSEATASGAGAPPPDPAEMTRQELWRAGKALLKLQGMPATQCGDFVGKLVREYGEEVVVEAVRVAVAGQVAEAKSFLTKVCQQRKAGAGPRGKPSEAERDAMAAQSTAEAQRELHGARAAQQQRTIDV